MNRFLLTVLSLCFIGSQSSWAASIFSQTTPQEPNSAFASNDSLSTSQRVADNFSVDGSGPITIRSLRFIGGFGLDLTVSDDFRVAFLADAGGFPGKVLPGGDIKVGDAFSRIPTDGGLLNGVTVPLEYVINLPNAITVNPNTPYWISITNDLLPASGWGWARAGGVFDQSTAFTSGSVSSGPWDTFTNGGMWFELNSHVVPEPCTTASLLFVLLAASLCRPKSYLS